ncbi:MAG: hypothetical protein ACPL7L_04780, partial [bacterium]
LLKAFQMAFEDRAFALNPVNPPLPPNAVWEDLKGADTYVVIGVDLNERYGVVGSMVKRRVVPGEAKLIAVEAGSLAGITDFSYEYKDLDTAIGEARKGERVLVIYSSLPQGISERLSVESGFKFLFLPYETNTMAFLELGIEHRWAEGKVKIFVGENPSFTRSPGDFIVVFTPFETRELREKADLLIPIAGYLEGEGTFVTLEGKRVYRQKVIAPAEGVLTVEEITSRLEKI